MKIRQGFVSNSSSSSFIVPIPKKLPKDKKSWLDYFGFLGDERLIAYYDDENITAGYFISTILSEGEVLTKEQFIERVRSRIYWDSSPWRGDNWVFGKPICSKKLLDKYIALEKEKNALGWGQENKEERDILLNKIDLVDKKIATEWANNWLKEKKIDLRKYNLYEFDHEDKPAESRVMHDGEPYRNVVYMRISNH